MLTDFALRNLKPRAILYEVADRDGMYVIVSPKGTITFRYDYRINGRRETLTIGRYGFGGISLAEAREKLRGQAAAERGYFASVTEAAREGAWIGDPDLQRSCHPVALWGDHGRVDPFDVKERTGSRHLAGARLRGC